MGGQIITETIRQNRIDFLKAVAIISVVLFHYYPNIFSYGFIGIDVFFILSGYLIHNKLINDREYFFENRFRRIFPPYIILTTVCLLLGYKFLAPNELLQLVKQSNLGIIFMNDLNFGLNLDYFDTTNTSILLHTWSLGVEVKFYFFWFVITGIAIATKSNVRALARNILFISIAMNFLFSGDAINYYLFTSRLYEFLVGILVSEHNLKRYSTINFEQVKNINVKSIKTKILPLMSVLSLLVILFQPLVSSIKLYQFDTRLLLTFSVCILVSFILSNPQAMPSIFNNKVLIFLGRISYSLYLYHYPILYFKQLIHPSFNPLVEFCSFTITLISSYFSYKIFEIGFRNLAKKFLIIFSVFSVLFILIFNFLAQSTDGFVDRVPEFNKSYSQSYESMSKFKYETCWLSSKVIPSRADCSWGGDMLLLGDSYAGTFAAGISNEDLEKYGFSVYAKSACLPLVTGQNVDCSKFNEFILNQLKILAPKIIVISAKWQKYRVENPQLFNNFLNLVLNFDKETKIILLGSPPQWTNPLPSIIAPQIRTLKPNFSKIKDSANQSVIDTEKFLRQEIPKKDNVILFSILEKYCSEIGCTPVTKSGKALLSFDQGHFTPYFAQEIFSEIILMKEFRF